VPGYDADLERQRLNQMKQWKDESSKGGILSGKKGSKGGRDKSIRNWEEGSREADLKRQGEESE
jgi:hypothetical protein